MLVTGVLAAPKFGMLWVVEILGVAAGATVVRMGAAVVMVEAAVVVVLVVGLMLTVDAVDPAVLDERCVWVEPMRIDAVGV